MGGIVGGGETVQTFEAEAAFGEALVVVKGTGSLQVKLPAAANAGSIVGVSNMAGDPADAKYALPSVITRGPAEATAAAAVNIGQYVKIHGVTGKVTPIGGEASGTVVQVVGRALTPAAGDLSRFTLDVSPFQYQIN